MAVRMPAEAVPVLRVEGSPEEIGEAVGVRFGPQIRQVVNDTRLYLQSSGMTADELRQSSAPFVRAAERRFPQYLAELASLSRAADVEFDVVFHLNCTGFRPSRRGPDVEGLEEGRCTSIVSRSEDGVVAGHNEDGPPIALEELYLIDATVRTGADSDSPGSRFVGLNYVQTLAGCSATVNQHGLIVLVNSLPDDGLVAGVPRDFITRALVDAPGIDAAIGLLEDIERGSTGSFVLVQGHRITSVEITPSHVSVRDVEDEGVFVHTNHFLHAPSGLEIEADRFSVDRLEAASRYAGPGMSVEQMKTVLAERRGNICRDRTLGSFIAHSDTPKGEVCWGEPGTGVWSEWTL